MRRNVQKQKNITGAKFYRYTPPKTARRVWSLSARLEHTRIRGRKKI